jgi:NAD(P)H-dependent flavin oxidoreductase YrpB (nitropropane dioxygenase family)
LSSALQTRLCDVLGIEYPIIQTGMGWVATPELVAACSNAGAIGFLAAATIPPEDVGAAIDEVQALTDKPFGVNFLMDAPGADVIIDAILSRGVAAAGYNRAPSAQMIEKLKAGGVKCVPTCGAPKHAAKAEKLGADAIIVQGSEGGGHTGNTPTSLLISEAADLVKVPIVAAGGFKDGRGLVAALAFGAEGVAMGTRFLLTQESPVPKITTDRYLAASMDDVIVTEQVDGMPQRVVVNELVKKLESASSPELLLRAMASGLEYRKLSGASVGELLTSAISMKQNDRRSNAQTLMAANAPILAKRAMQDGDPVGGYLPSGTVAGVIDDIPTAGEVIERIVAEAEKTLAKLSG